ncbi:hypothetical protein VP01_7635g1, partial [Puccinia sorghi]
LFPWHLQATKFQKERRLNANLNLSGIAHLPSFICWADQSWKKIISIVKFYLQNIISQTAYQNPNQSNGPQYSGKMYSIAAKVAKDPDGYFLFSFRSSL